MSPTHTELNHFISVKIENRIKMHNSCQEKTLPKYIVIPVESFIFAFHFQCTMLTNNSIKNINNQLK